MNNFDEIQRINSGPNSHEKPSGLGIVRFIVKCPGNSIIVLDKCKEILRIVINQYLNNKWPSEDKWDDLLPKWFVQRCSKEKSIEEEEQWLINWKKLSLVEQREMEQEESWSVSNWIYWFRPEIRQWYWWDAVIKNKNFLYVAIDVKNWPFPWGALKWLLKACGAIDVFPEPD